MTANANEQPPLSVPGLTESELFRDLSEIMSGIFDLASGSNVKAIP